MHGWETNNGIDTAPVTGSGNRLGIAFLGRIGMTAADVTPRGMPPLDTRGRAPLLSS